MTSLSPDREVAQVMRQLISEDSSPEQLQRQKQSRRTRSRRSAASVRTVRNAPASDTSTNDEGEMMATAMTNYTRGNTSAGLALVQPPTLFLLAGQGETAALRQKLESSSSETDVNKRDEYGHTPLMHAAHFGWVSCVELLIEHGADVSACANNGRDALMLAATEDHHDVIRALVKHDVDVNRQDNCGNTALMFTAIKNHRTSAALLLEHGADAFARNHASTSAYELAVTRNNQEVQSVFEEQLMKWFAQDQ